MEKRIRVLTVCFITLIGVLVLRLAYIQLLGNYELTEAARKQQDILLEGADTRGVIYDRNGTPIAGDNREYIYIIKSDDCDGETQNALNAVQAEEIKGENSDYRVFTSDQYDKSIGKRLISNSGAYIMMANRRYEEDQPAVHIIGYINPKDKSGASGLELMYDEELSMLDRKVAAAADVQGTLLQGYGLTVTTSADEDDYVKEGITTTLDLGVQKKAEQVLSGCGKNGAVVVTKCRTGEIVAATSTPIFDPSSIESYMTSGTGELINKVTQGEYPPGSIFKIVVAAAALEAGGDPERRFTCDGTETVNGHSVTCNTGGENGHGEITLEEAMAYSCNCAFIKLGQETGAEAIIDMAEKLGLGRTVLEGYPGEKDGNLMTSQQSGGAAIANLSIGQGETLVTPLQVAHMTSVLANGGVDMGLSVIMENEKEAEGIRCLNSETVMTLQQMMNAVVKYGTAEGLDMSVSSGGKTGSAESVQGGKDVVHGWMTGYLPAEEPEYTVTVFVENGRSGKDSAGPVFAKIAEYLSSRGILESEIGF